MRRTRKLALTGAALLLAIATAIGIDELVWRGAHAAAVTSALADAIMDPSSIFALRSPGERGSGPLLQTKGERVALAPGLLPPGPEERVLANVRERPPETELALAEPPFILSQPPGPELGAPPPIPPSQFFPTPLGGGSITPPLLSGPLTPPNAQTTPPGGGLPPTPVPEPAVWTLMILAIFSVGAALRWKRTEQRMTRDGSTGLNA
jgi:hypothetical protein